MARPGVTYGEVVEAINQLIGQGKNPTIEQVRIILGTGSSTTIANHLKDWKEQQDDTYHIANKENLPKEFVALMKGLWERLVNHADEKIAENEANAREQMNQVVQELKSSRQRIAEVEQQYEQVRQEKISLTQTKETLEQLLSTEKIEHAALKSSSNSLITQLTEKQEWISELSRLHSQAQANLEHYREAAREQRLLDQEQYEQNKRELQAEIKALKDQAIFTHEKLTSLQQNYQSLQQVHTTLNANLAKLTTQHEMLQTQLIENEKIKTEALQTSLHWQNMYQVTEKKMDIHTQKLIEVESQYKLVQEQLNTAQHMLQEVLEEKKVIGHEKWILSQEKAQLEGQIQQMQRMLSQSA